jgi:hypothetical protein
VSEDEEPHGLFLPEDPEAPMCTGVKFISVTRLSPVRESAGRVFPADELPDPDAVRQRFGGGTYRVIARDANKRVVLGGMRDLSFGGPPKPMDGSEPTPPPQPLNLPATANTQDSRIERLERLLEKVLTQPAPAPPLPPPLPIELLLKMQADSQANMLTMVKEIMSAKSEDKTQTHDIFLAGQEHAAAIYQGIIEAEREKAAAGGGDDTEILKTVQVVFEGIKSAKSSNGNGGK